MTDAAAAKPAATAGQSKNSAAPEPEVTAAAAPCECAERLNTLEGRMSAYEGVNKALSWLMLAAAAAIIYVLWNAPGTGAKET